MTEITKLNLRQEHSQFLVRKSATTFFFIPISPLFVGTPANERFPLPPWVNWATHCFARKKHQKRTTFLENSSQVYSYLCPPPHTFQTYSVGILTLYLHTFFYPGLDHLLHHLLHHLYQHHHFIDHQPACPNPILVWWCWSRISPVLCTVHCSVHFTLFDCTLLGWVKSLVLVVPSPHQAVHPHLIPCLPHLQPPGDLLVLHHHPPEADPEVRLAIFLFLVLSPNNFIFNPQIKQVQVIYDVLYSRLLQEVRSLCKVFHKTTLGSFTFR